MDERSREARAFSGLDLKKLFICCVFPSRFKISRPRLPTPDSVAIVPELKKNWDSVATFVVKFPGLGGHQGPVACADDGRHAAGPAGTELLSGAVSTDGVTTLFNYKIFSFASAP